MCFTDKFTSSKIHMRKKLLFIITTIIFVSAQAQQVIIGKISTESGAEIPNATVFNVRTEQRTLTDQFGNFAIPASATDELRFVVQGFERVSKKIESEDFARSVNVILRKGEIAIEEVIIAFKPTGNLKKDSRALDEAPKVVALNTNLRSTMRGPQTEVLPTLTTPSSFGPRNFSTGQVNLIQIASALASLAKKAATPHRTTANYAETTAFLGKVKNAVDWTYFEKHGFDEEEIDRFLIYANDRFFLAKNYRKNFNKVAIENILKGALKEYQKTHKPISS